MHSQGVLHCDLKSSNILISKSWQVKICDFGLAFTCPPSSLALARVPLGCIGTHHWTAPEVLRGEEFSRSADVYSFGAIVWEMVHRRVPYEYLTAIQVVGLVGFGGRRLQVGSGSSACPRPVAELIRTCCSHIIGERRMFGVLGEELLNLHRMAVVDVEDNLDHFFISNR